MAAHAGRAGAATALGWACRAPRSRLAGAAAAAAARGPPWSGWPPPGERPAAAGRAASSSRAAAPPAGSAGWDEAPRSWERRAAPGGSRYTHADVATWRAEFGFARRQHSLAQFGYTDDELLEWRRQFDELADGGGEPATISLEGFKRMCARKYGGIVKDDELARKVEFFWKKFDRDGNRRVDFGEFIACGLLIDVDGAKEKIRRDGVDATFELYAEDGFMSEPNFFKLMCDFRFFVATATDVRKLVRHADKDSDGLVSLSDFLQWAESSDASFLEEPPRPSLQLRRACGPRLTPPPPPEPEG